MDKIEVTWSYAIRIWWSLAWRVVVFGGLASFLLGLLIGAIGAATGVQTDVIQTWGEIGGMLVSIPVGIWVVKVILTRDFPKYRLLLVPSLESRIENRLNKQTTENREADNHGQ